MVNRNEVALSVEISIEVWFDKSDRLWCGQLRDRINGDQIGDAWWSVSRDEALVWGGVYYMAHRRADVLSEAKMV